MAKKFVKAAKPAVDRKRQIGVVVILILVFMGFSVAGYYGMGGGGGQPQQQDIPQTDYGFATSMGIQGANVGQITDALAIFGQLDSPVSLVKRLSGELYVMNSGATHLILTKASETDIKDKAKGEYLIYRVAKCDTGFGCLVEGPVNGTMTFDVYMLDRNSSFIPSGMVGLPTAAEPVVL